MGYCANCGLTRRELLKTAYGDYICEDCWDEYICTDAGKLEYLIGICNNDYPMSDFDADFLCEVIMSWRAHSRMIDFTPQQRFEIEEKAHKLGLL